MNRPAFPWLSSQYLTWIWESQHFLDAACFIMLGYWEQPLQLRREKPFFLLIPSSHMVPIYSHIPSTVFKIALAKGHWNSHFWDCSIFHSHRLKFLLEALCVGRKGWEENKRWCYLPSACMKADLYWHWELILCIGTVVCKEDPWVTVKECYLFALKYVRWLGKRDQLQNRNMRKWNSSR